MLAMTRTTTSILVTWLGMGGAYLAAGEFHQDNVVDRQGASPRAARAPVAVELHALGVEWEELHALAPGCDGLRLGAETVRPGQGVGEAPGEDAGDGEDEVEGGSAVAMRPRVVVPEPGSALLFLAGVGLAVHTWHRRRR